MSESLNRKMPIPWCLIIIQNLLIPAALHFCQPPADQGPSISSLMEKFILVETSHEKSWIHPWTWSILEPVRQKIAS